MVNQIRDKKFDCILGVNIGPNKGSRGQQRIDDYSECFSKVIEHTDYVTINISSPNTENLRDFHNLDELGNLLDKILAEKKKLNSDIPIALKVSPDIDNTIVKDISKILIQYKVMVILTAEDL